MAEEPTRQAARPTGVHTVGHSNRSSAELVLLLLELGIERLVDVRRYPGSRRHPHFAREALSRSLAEHGIGYEHEPDLGGQRTPSAASRHAVLEPAFAGYAEHMESDAFRCAVERVLSAEMHVALMCAERDPMHCHRRLLSDYLVASGVDVLHAIGPGEVRAHRLDPRARVEPGPRLVYPGGGSQLELFV
jgi:uncharacterized protein (DUF488 family)